jgi:hypothetical protein
MADDDYSETTRDFVPDFEEEDMTSTYFKSEAKRMETILGYESDFEGPVVKALAKGHGVNVYVWVLFSKSPTTFFRFKLCPANKYGLSNLDAYLHSLREGKPEKMDQRMLVASEFALDIRKYLKDSKYAIPEELSRVAKASKE